MKFLTSIIWILFLMFQLSDVLGQSSAQNSDRVQDSRKIGYIGQVPLNCPKGTIPHNGKCRRIH